MLDPRDADAVAAALADWASRHFDGPVTRDGTATPLTGGLDSYLHAVALAGPTLPDAWRRPLVVRLLPSADRDDQARREAEVQRWCQASGFPVPQVLHVFAAGELFDLPAQVMQRVSGQPMLAAMSAAPWRAGRLATVLGTTARSLHSLVPDGWPGPAEPTATIDQRLGLARRAVDDLRLPDLADALAVAERVAGAAVGTRRVICHGDFHPLNVMVDGDRPVVLDWTDATIGPPEADVSRTLLLFAIAAATVDRPVERAGLRVLAPVLARRYRRGYGADDLDPALLVRWEVLHLVHGWAQIETLRAGGFDGRSSASPDAVPPAMLDTVRRRFHRTVRDLDP